MPLPSDVAKRLGCNENETAQNPSVVGTRPQQNNVCVAAADSDHDGVSFPPERTSIQPPITIATFHLINALSHTEIGTCASPHHGPGMKKLVKRVDDLFNASPSMRFVSRAGTPGSHTCNRAVELASMSVTPSMTYCTAGAARTMPNTQRR
jgi:hypothetical protein